MIMIDSTTTDRIRVAPPAGHNTFYDRRSAKLCVHCGQMIMWMYTNTGGGRKLPFDADLVAKEDDRADEGWLPGMFSVRGRKRMVMAPVLHHGGIKRDRVTHVALLHRCPQYLEHVAAQQEVVA